MAKSIEKQKLENQVFLCACKHRGNIDKIAKELDLPYDLVAKMCAKHRKKRERDVNLMVCSTIMELVMEGRESRIVYYHTMLDATEGRDAMELSTCCRSLMVVKVEHEPRVCLKCGKQSESYIEHQAGIFDLRMRLLEELRKEDIAVVACAEKMGYTQKQEPIVYKDQRQIVMIGGQRQKGIEGIPVEQQLLLEETKNLSPIERTDLINKIQYGLLKTIQEEKNKDDKSK